MHNKMINLNDRKTQSRQSDITENRNHMSIYSLTNIKRLENHTTKIPKEYGKASRRLSRINNSFCYVAQQREFFLAAMTQLTKYSVNFYKMFSKNVKDSFPTHCYISLE